MHTRLSSIYIVNERGQTRVKRRLNILKLCFILCTLFILRTTT